MHPGATTGSRNFSNASRHIFTRRKAGNWGILEAQRREHRDERSAKVIRMAASEDKIVEVERHFSVRFPEDYRRFLLTHGSMSQFLPPANSYLSLYPIEEVIPFNEAGDIQERFPGAIVIGGDGSREMLAYDFRHDQATLVLLDITAEDWSEAIPQASSLMALLEQFPERGWVFK
jgi:hypothetical protein